MERKTPQPSPEESAERLRLTLPMMTRHKVPVTPENYAVWYRYTSGDNTELKARIGELISTNTKFTADLNTELFNQYAATCDIAQFEKVREEMTDIISDVSTTLETAGTQTENFGGTLDGVVENVEKSTSLDDIRNLLTTLVEETKSVRHSQQLMFEHFESKGREIDLLQEELERERKRATTDPLTGIANRQALFDELNMLAVNDNKLSFLMIDIDHFKGINDQYGHLIGDRVIRFVTQAMQKNIKGKDMAARYGGEEFAAVLPDTDEKEAEAVAEAIRKTIADAKLVRSDNKEPMDQITVSIGIACYRRNEDSMELVNRADQALYQAKNAGRNCVKLSGTLSSVTNNNAG